MDDADAAARAARRRREYAGEIVIAGTPKPALYEELDLAARLTHMTALSRRLATMSGKTEAPRPRAEWPGEILALDHR